MKKNTFLFLACICCSYVLVTFNFGCAQISAPTGGPRDTLPPRLVRANPGMNSINVTGNKMSLTFDEYIDIQDIQTNLLVSPVQKTNPLIVNNLKSVSIKFRDTLLPNTTYSINFGSSLRDYHEGNVLENFTYVFSTGPTIDSLTMQGKVLLAESGKPDSTIVAMLHRDTNDTAVVKKRPDYIAKVDGKGNFKFRNLPAGTYKLYALKDGDGGKTYNSKTELFAFMDTTVTVSKDTMPATLFAYTEQKSTDNKPEPKSAPEKRLRYTANLTADLQDLLQPLELSFNNPLKKFDIQKAQLTDTNYRPLNNYTISLDSTHRKVLVKTTWVPETPYRLLIQKDAVEDSTGLSFLRSDTLRFTTKGNGDYGRIVLRFTNIDLSKHPVIQFFDADKLRFSYPITSTEWSNKLFPPGDYFIRILYDLDNNGVWDPGNYSKKIQPEIATELSQKLSIRADWDNEREIRL